MKAIILAAGRGSRMKELTDEKPKCLIRGSSVVHAVVVPENLCCPVCEEPEFRANSLTQLQGRLAEVHLRPIRPTFRVNNTFFFKLDV